VSGLTQAEVTPLPRCRKLSGFSSLSAPYVEKAGKRKLIGGVPRRLNLCKKATKFFRGAFKRRAIPQAVLPAHRRGVIGRLMTPACGAALRNARFRAHVGLTAESATCAMSEAMRDRLCPRQ
jgi:hypothetical protein